MLMEDNDSYYYDFYGLEERVFDIQTQVSEVHEDVKIIETQISELVSVQSEQFSELMSVQSEQFSEMVSIIGNTTDYISATKQCAEMEVILLIAVILFCGFISGLLIVNLTRK